MVARLREITSGDVGQTLLSALCSERGRQECLPLYVTIGDVLPLLGMDFLLTS